MVRIEGTPRPGKWHQARHRSRARGRPRRAYECREPLPEFLLREFLGRVITLAGTVAGLRTRRSVESGERQDVAADVMVSRTGRPEVDPPALEPGQPPLGELGAGQEVQTFKSQGDHLPRVGVTAQCDAAGDQGKVNIVRHVDQIERIESSKRAARKRDIDAVLLPLGDNPRCQQGAGRSLVHKHIQVVRSRLPGPRQQQTPQCDQRGARQTAIPRRPASDLWKGPEPGGPAGETGSSSILIPQDLGRMIVQPPDRTFRRRDSIRQVRAIGRVPTRNQNARLLPIWCERNLLACWVSLASLGRSREDDQDAVTSDAGVQSCPERRLKNEWQHLRSRFAALLANRAGTGRAKDWRRTCGSLPETTS